MTPKWKRMAEVYRFFADEWSDVCDFSDDAARTMFRGESGQGPMPDYAVADSNGRYNGYAVGKHWMDVTLAMWREDLEKGLLFPWELYDDDTLPDWWLDRVLPERCRKHRRNAMNISREMAA